MLDWDDLRYILAIYDNGSALAAAQKLGVNASTVQRRVTRFETQNNVHLFERLQSGYRPTAECEVLMQEARNIDDSVASIGRKILGQDLRLEGRLTVTSTETFMSDLIAQQLEDFHQLHPNITVNFTLTNSRLNLSRQDADIAIRPSHNPPDNLVGQRVSDLGFGIYARPEVVATLPTTPTLDDLRGRKWLGVGEALSGSPSYIWMQDNIPSDSCWLYIDSYGPMAICASHSLGLAVLPCIVADPMPELQRVLCPWFQMRVPVWVLTHQEIRNAARVRAFMDHITKAIRQNRVLLEGRPDGD